MCSVQWFGGNISHTPVNILTTLPGDPLPTSLHVAYHPLIKASKCTKNFIHYLNDRRVATGVWFLEVVLNIVLICSIPYGTDRFTTFWKHFIFVDNFDILTPASKVYSYCS